MDIDELIDDIVERADIHGNKKYETVDMDVSSLNYWIRFHIHNNVIINKDQLESQITYMFRWVKDD